MDLMAALMTGSRGFKHSRETKSSIRRIEASSCDCTHDPIIQLPCMSFRSLRNERITEGELRGGENRIETENCDGGKEQLCLAWLFRDTSRWVNMSSDASLPALHFRSCSPLLIFHPLAFLFRDLFHFLFYVSLPTWSYYSRSTTFFSFLWSYL